MKKRILLCLLVMFLMAGGIVPFSLFSQEESPAEPQEESVIEKSDTEKTHLFFQLSLLYPLGTNLINAFKISNTLSFNILIGFNGGVQGLEIGTININRGDVLGFQAATLLNITKGKSSGFIASGLGNILVGDGEGIFFSPILNIHHGSVTGLQAATVNYAKKLKGLQLGLINIVGDGKDAIPLGLLNIVIKNGYRAFDIYAGDLFYGNVSFKMGVERLYTIFRGGYTTKDSTKDDVSPLLFGIGLGTIIPLAEKHRISIDVISGNNPTSSDHLSSLLELSIHYRYSVTKHFELFIGPTLNYLYHIYSVREVANTSPPFGGNYAYDSRVNEDEILTPHYSLLKDAQVGENLYYLWIGGNIGVSFRF